jgi:peptide deformylase
MSIKPIFIYPSPNLKEKSIAIDPNEPGAKKKVQGLLRDMVETMHANNGVGLSAVQIGELKRIVVTLDGVYVNPEILARDGEQKEVDEGCLSFPGIFEKVNRYPQVTVTALDAQLRPFTVTKEGLMAQCLQHEIEHLEGMLLSDKMTAERKETVTQQMLKVGRKL